jgi:hypothetical protein
MDFHGEVTGLAFFIGTGPGLPAGGSADFAMPAPVFQLLPNPARFHVY